MAFDPPILTLETNRSRLTETELSTGVRAAYKFFDDNNADPYTVYAEFMKFADGDPCDDRQAELWDKAEEAVREVLAYESVIGSMGKQSAELSGKPFFRQAP